MSTQETGGANSPDNTSGATGTTTVETPETANTSGVDTVSIDDFMSMDFNDDPKLAAVMSQEHKGLKPYKEILLGQTTEEGRKLVSNLRASYTRQTQALAEAKRALQEEREAVAREKEALYSGDFARQVQETAAKDRSQLDPYDADQLAQIIEIETAKKLEAMLKPMQSQIKEQQAVMQAERFIAEHPDMKTDAFKAKLIPLISTREDMDLETAYWMIKGQLADEAAALAGKQKVADKEKKVGIRQEIMKTASSSNVGATKPPKNLSPFEAMQWYKQNKR